MPTCLVDTPSRTVLHVVPLDERGITSSAIADPRVEVGGFQVSFSWPAPTPRAGATAARNAVGIVGFHRGVAWIVTLYGPDPTAFTAATRNRTPGGQDE
jgi:hypothetical protein